MKKHAWIAFLLAFSIAPFLQASPPEGPGYSWKTVFQDNFDGSSLNTAKWKYNYPWSTYHNSRANMQASQVKVQDGKLILTAENKRTIWEPWGINRDDFGWLNLDYTSGTVNTNATFKFKYGYIESSIKAPRPDSTWPAFWMLQDGWPPENDIMEIQGNRWRWYTNYHYTNSSGNHASYFVENWGPDLAGGFHTYGMHWTAGSMNYYFDNSYKNGFSDSAAIADSGSMYLLLTLAVGGWAPAPDAADYPSSMECDWVRIWQRNQDTVKENITWLKLDDSTGASAADSSGKNMNGTLQNGLNFPNSSVEGATGQALNFDGVDDYIDLPDGYGEFDNGFSAIFWAKPAAVKSWARFIDLGNGPNSNNIVIARRSSSNDLYLATYGGATGSTISAVNAIQTNIWQCFAVTINTAGNAVIYKNGQSVQTGNVTWPWGVIRTENYIGRSNWSSDAFYRGLMDDIRIYDYALTPRQISDIFDTTVQNGVCMSEYAVQYDFNEDCVIDLPDLMIFTRHWMECGLYPVCR